jgi:hypothetical protein
MEYLGKEIGYSLHLATGQHPQLLTIRDINGALEDDLWYYLGEIVCGWRHILQDSLIEQTEEEA